MSKFNYIECSCYNACHSLRISKDEDTGEMYLEVHLTQYKWYTRIGVAIRYILGITNKLMYFEESILDKKQQQQLRELLDVGSYDA